MSKMASVSISTALSLCSLFHLTRKPYLSPSPLSFSYISKPHKRKVRVLLSKTNSLIFHHLISQKRNERSLGCMQWHHPTQKNQLPTTLGFIQPLMKLPKAISCNKLLLKRVDVPELKFSLYFLGYEDVSKAPSDPVDRTAWTFGKPATIELTHNWGTESDPEFKGYHNGNSEPRGFGHIGITVDDAIKACERFERLGVEFVKKLDAGKMRGIAFIKDPDGYWIEIFDLKSIGEVISHCS